jgi:alkaline phosphatase D
MVIEQLQSAKVVERVGIIRQDGEDPTIRRPRPRVAGPGQLPTSVAAPAAQHSKVIDLQPRLVCVTHSNQKTQGLSRRRFLALATAMGASAAWAQNDARASTVDWREDRDAFPEGVASGDPHSDSVILWTRYPVVAASPAGGQSADLTVEVAEDEGFARVVARARVRARPESDWTCRVLVGTLKPQSVYWYRFTAPGGTGSRVGRTRTAPLEHADYRAKFAFISCQNATMGAQNTYRRMIHDDERAPHEQQLDFVFHQGDFIYELTWYPEDRPQGMYDRRLRDLYRYPSGEKVKDFHIPTSVEDYRTAYRAYLHDPDLQDARARWAFVNMWDNHEFSWLGYQSLQIFEGRTYPRQTRKVAANQAWFEYQPARVFRPQSTSLERFEPPRVEERPIENFDDHGMGQEPNNLAAIGSLRGYRTVRWGRHLDLFITDQHSYRSEDPLLNPGAKELYSDDFPEFLAEDAAAILDAGRTYHSGHPPQFIQVGAIRIANFRAQSPPQTILGAEQKRWFLERLKSSQATWKLWGNTEGTFEWRADLQNLPPGSPKPWPSAGYATMATQDHSTALVERAEIYDFVRQQGITGFGIVAGDRHSFWAGTIASSLPPKRFEPVGVQFVSGSISAPGAAEAYEHKIARDHPLYALYFSQPPGREKPDFVMNLTMLHGVRAALEYSRTGDAATARRLSNREMAPNLTFLDLASHGYAIARVSADELECEFVCLDRPIERSTQADGGAVRYRVIHRTKLWKAGQAPVLTQDITEGQAELCV